MSAGDAISGATSGASAGSAAGPWGAAIGAVLGGAASLFGAKSAKRKRNDAINEGLRQQDRLGMDASNTTADFISQLRRSAPNPAVERGLFTQSLGSPAISGPGGARFRADAAATTAGTHDYGAQLADLFARIRAPQLQHQQENETLVGLGNALRPIQLQSQNQAFLTNQKLGNAQVNPWLSLLGQSGAGIGQGIGTLIGGKK